MMRIIKCIQLRILPVDGQCVLGQIVSTDTEEIHFLRQLCTHHDSSRCLDHNTLLRFSESHTLFCQFLFYLRHNFFDPVDFFHADDHGIHNGDITKCAGAEQCTELCLEDLRSGQTDTDGAASHGRIFLRLHFEVIALLVCTDVQCTDDHRLSRHGLRHSAVDLKLFFLGREGFSLQI